MNSPIYVGVLLSALGIIGCSSQGDERLIEKARLEGQAAAEAEIKTKLENIDKLSEIARQEGRAMAEAELETQRLNMGKIAEKSKIEARTATESELHTIMMNLDVIAEKARTEGRASTEAEIRVQMENIETLLNRSRQEGRASAEGALLVENETWARRAAEMNTDLQARQRFYQGIKGTYEGTMRSDQGNFSLKFKFVPSLFQPPTERLRTLDEIAQDISGLNFNIQAIQWSPQNRLSSVGCRIQAVKPDIGEGAIEIAAEACPNYFYIQLSDSTQPQKTSAQLSQELRAGTLTEIKELKGEVQPTNNSTTFKFNVRKVQREL